MKNILFILAFFPLLLVGQIRADQLTEITSPAATDAFYTAERGQFQKITLARLSTYFGAGGGLQSLTMSGDTLKATTTGGTVLFVVLPYLRTEVDGSVTNELQTVTIDSTETAYTLTLSNGGGAVTFQKGAAADVEALQTLTGVTALATDLGTFTGTTIPDGSDNKEALQALETAVEAGGGDGYAIYNIEDYGAIGTDTLSDQTAFDTVSGLLRANPGSTMYIPSGTWVYTDSIQVPSNSRVIGAGRDETLLIADTPNLQLGLSAGIITFMGNNSYAANFSIDGRFTPTNWTFDQGSDNAYANRSSGITYEQNATGNLAENIKIRRVMRHGVLVFGHYNIIRAMDIDSTNSYNVSFGGLPDLTRGGMPNPTYSTLEQSRMGAVSKAKGPIELNDGLNGITVRDVEVIGTGRSSAGGAIFIHTHANPTEQIENVLIERVTLDNTQAINILGSAVDLTGEPLVMSDIVIRDCIVRNQAGAVSVLEYSRRVTIDNLKTENLSGSAVNIRGRQSTSAEITRDVTIINSTLRGTGRTAINVDSCAAIIVSNNRIEGWQYQGINISNADSVSISGNIIRLNNTAATYGIRFTGDTSRVVNISANSFFGTANGAIAGIGLVKDMNVTSNFLSPNAFNGTLRSDHHVAGNRNYFSSREQFNPWTIGVPANIYADLEGGTRNACIGCTLGVSTLNVHDSNSNAVVQLTTGTYPASATQGFTFLLHTNGEARFINYNNAAHVFRVNNTTEVLKLNSAGGDFSLPLDMSSNKITGLGTPTLSTDAATKAYADTKLSGTGTAGRSAQFATDGTLENGTWLTSGGVTESTLLTAVGIARGTTAEAPSATTAGRLRWNTTTARPTISDGATHARIPLMYSATATLDFPSTSANATSDLTITLTGAVVGEQVIWGTPNSAVTVGGTFSAFVSAANTVTVRFRAGTAGAEDPAAGSFTVSIIR